MIEEKQTASISAEPIEIIPQEKISQSNELKWKMTGKKYLHTYLEAKQYAAFANILEDEGDRIIKVLLKFYFESRELEPKIKKVSEAILNLMATIESGSKDIDKNVFFAKVDALADYIKEYEY